MDMNDKNSWQILANQISQDRPSEGKQVEVVEGRKHKGKIGKVLQHQVDKFQNAFRYGGEGNLRLREMAGRYGYVCLIDTGIEKFWVKAHYLKILSK